MPLSFESRAASSGRALFCLPLALSSVRRLCRRPLLFKNKHVTRLSAAAATLRSRLHPAPPPPLRRPIGWRAAALSKGAPGARSQWEVAALGASRSGEEGGETGSGVLLGRLLGGMNTGTQVDMGKGRRTQAQPNLLAAFAQQPIEGRHVLPNPPPGPASGQSAPAERRERWVSG